MPPRPKNPQKKQKKKRKRLLGLPPLALFSGAALLLVLGLAGGMALDLALRPKPVPRPPAVAERPPAAPIIRNLPKPPETETPSILARPAAPSSAPALAHEQQPAPPPMSAYATPSVDHGQPALAIVIDDMGLDRTRSAEVLTLPGPVTVSLMTYAEDLNGLASRAREAGHEVMAHVPMQPRDASQNPGPHALTVAMDGTAIHAALDADLDGWHGYVGINNHMGSRFTGDRAGMDVVMRDLRARGLFWLDSRTTAASAGPAAAEAAGVPYVARDVFLDDVETIAAIQAQLEQAVKVAKAHGTAIAIGHPHDATIAALRAFLPTLESRGVALVPVTDILKRQQNRAHPS